MLKGKLALITGSTSGIGLAIAKKFASEGINIILNGFGSTEDIQTLVKDLKNSYAVDVFYNNADMRKPEEIKTMMVYFEEKHGGIDILVNNAGIQHVAPVEEFPEDKWNDILAINLSSAFHTVKHVVPSMKNKKWGRIINLASAHALVASPYKSAYVAAKHGIAGFTKTIALELAESNITVNAICPGYVFTTLVEKQIPDTARARGISEEEVIKDVLLASQPTKKFVTTEEVAAFAYFLCGDGASSITGAILPIEGGWTAK